MLPVLHRVASAQEPGMGLWPGLRRGDAVQRVACLAGSAYPDPKACWRWGREKVFPEVLASPRACTEPLSAGLEKRCFKNESWFFQ